MSPLGSTLSTLLVLASLLSDCGDAANAGTSPETEQPLRETESKDSVTDEDDEMLTIQMGDTTLYATLEDNSSAEAFADWLSDGPVSIAVQNYGGFEKVGALPQRLPRNDAQMTATAGDIMLYQGDSIVFFYGSNTWSYTKLGEITGFSQEELSGILGGRDTTVTLSITHPDEMD